MQVLFISESYLKEYTNLSENIDSKILKPSLFKAQDLYIEPFLGKTITNELKNQILNNNLTDLNKELLNLLRKAQIEFTAYLSYADVMFRIMNKGISNPNVENGSNIDRNDLSYIRDISKNQGDSYLKIVECFFKENKDSYPTFFNCNTKKDYSNFPMYFDNTNDKFLYKKYENL